MQGLGIRSSSDEGIRLVVGLGNPGREYEGTRHNIGFDVLDLLARRQGTSFSKDMKWSSLVARVSDFHLTLLKPTTFMNLSGEAVEGYARFHRIPSTSILVILDDVALPLGTLRLRREGGSGGQNGLRSVLKKFGTEHIPRLRVGVGGAESEERGGINLSDHVLSRFAPEEQTLASEAVSRAAEAVMIALHQGLDYAMNLYNATPSSVTPKDNTANPL